MATKKQRTVKTWFHHMCGVQYNEHPVDVLTFLKDEYYLGKATNKGRLIYTVWHDALEEIFGDDRKIVVVLTGAIGTGKSTVSVIALAYVMYRILCLKDAWKFFNLASSAQMALCFFNLTKSLGDSRGYLKLQSFLSSSPWFCDHLRSSMKTKQDGVTSVHFPIFSYILASPYAKGFGCFTSDVRVSLLDGRELTIPEIATEDKQHWVYAYDISKNKIVPGRVTFAGKTKIDVPIVKVTLDNDEVIRCTPDHPFLLRSGEYKEAQHLSCGDSLMPLYRQKGTGDYEQFYDVHSGKWLYTHRRMAGEIPAELRDSRGRFKKSIVVHHKDFNKHNHEPTNLKYMTGKGHSKLHAIHIRETCHTPEARAKVGRINRIRQKDPEVLRKNREGVIRSWTPERRKQQSERMKVYNENGLCLKGNKAAHTKEAKDKRSNTLRRWWQTDAGKKKRALLSGKCKGNAYFDCLKVNNHKVVSVEWCAETEDVYDLTVEGHHNFALSAGVFVHNTVGEDVVCGMMDEVDSPTESAKQKVRVLKAYEATVRRFESRFVKDEHTLGRLFLVASKQDEMSFIDTFITKMKSSGKVLIFDIPLWDAKHATHFSGVRFPVAVADAYNPPVIITEEQRTQYMGDGYRIVEVPVEFKDEFGRDLVGALRDLAGITIAGLRRRKLFASEKFIVDCFDATKQDPVKRQTIVIGLEDDVSLMMWLDLAKIRVPRSVPRYIHCDIAFTGDALGLSMCGISDWIEGNEEQEDGTFSSVRLPVIETDFEMRIKARDGDRIPIHKMRKFVLDLKAVGFRIAKFTSDLRLASEDTLQIFNKSGIPAEYLSVDKTDEAYVNYRNLVYEKRWVSHKNDRLLFELRNLERDVDKGKIDHPKEVTDVVFLEDGDMREVVVEGSKDVSDAVVGAVQSCIESADVPIDTKKIQQLTKILKETSAMDDPTGILLKTNDGREIEGLKGTGSQVHKMKDIMKKLR